MTIKNASAYYQKRTPGAPMAGDDGTVIDKHDTVIVVYLELQNGDPKWDAGWANGAVYTIQATKVNGDSVTIFQKNSVTKSIRASATNRLWLLELLRQDSTSWPPKKIKSGEVLLRGMLQGKTIYFKLNGMTEIASPEYM